MSIDIKKLLSAAPAILEASSEAIATIDIDGQIKGFNSHFLELLGITEEECKGLNISEIFRDLDDTFILRGTKDEFEPAKLTSAEGQVSWVLVKVIGIGKTGKETTRTVLVHDPETIRRIIDRLDYIENYDTSTGLLNHRKGIVEFEQLQASNLAGGCILLDLEPGPSVAADVDLTTCIRSIARHFKLIEEQSVLCRLANSEVLCIYSSTEPLPADTLSSLIDAIRTDSSVPDGVRPHIAHLDWKAGTISVNGILDRLKAELTPIDEPHLLAHLDAQQHATSHASFLLRLNQALEAGELDFFIQPQICSEGRQVIGGELLIRWIPSPGEIIPPAHFIEFLEQGEFADKFFYWGLVRTAQVLKTVRDELDMWIPLSLNLATTHFHDRQMMTALADTMREYNIPSEILEVEITERILADDPEAVLENLEHLREQGFKIAIDDFGTGYSSLSYLRRFPLDRLKIDRVFVSNLEENEEDRLIVTSIASLAHILGLEIVAEGIEEPFQASFLKNIGCEYFQGYLTGKPMPVDAFIEFARHNPEHSEWLEEPSKFRSEHSLESKARKVKWKKSFSTDVVSVDNEHRALIDALNTFSDLYMKDPESIDITETLDVIALEAIKHFDHEEDVMFNIGYPRYEMHREKHKWLIADIAKRKLEISEHKQGTSFDEVLQYLKYWLLRHLVSEDTHLHRFINKPSSERRS
ncbi:MAG: EAL domain-containing protein [Candidatus Thiodiazotropha taylori]|nr:EAL domain-containing protein [Candidatus Thiodiazotropha taylori]